MPNGAELFSQSLKQLGVTRIFTLVGDHLNEALQILDRDGFQIVDTRHESAAVHMADGWARMSGRLAVSLVTGGPGHINSIAGIATAQASGVPLLAVSGQSNSKQRDRNGFQDMDQLGFARSAAKYCASPASAAEIPFYVREAYRAATTGRPGASHLSIAVDHFTDRVENVPQLAGSVGEHRPAPDSSQVARVMEILQAAARPAVVAGSGCFWAGAGPALGTFIERTQTPLFTITMARGLVSDDHPYCFGYADPTINHGAENALKQADVVLVLGKRIDYRLRLGGLFAPDAKVIQVDIHPEELGLNRALEAGLNCDCRLALEALNAEAEGRPQPNRSDWLAEVQRGCDEYAAEVDERSRKTSQPMHALEFYTQMREWLPEDATLCWDGGDFVHWGRYVLPARRPGHWMRLGALAGLGVGFPIGLAAQVLRPKQRSIVVTGDGSLGFYLAEMDTAVRFNLPLIIIVGNDGSWGVERELQEGRYEGKTVACDLRRTRYDLVMKGFGGDGAHVERPEQIRPALDQALASDKPFVINVEIDGAGSPFTEAQLRPK